MLLVQTEGGMLSSLDSETGRTIWDVQIGPRGRQTSEAAANTQYVTAINGSMLYVLDRASGNVLWKRQLSGAPGAGTAVSETHVFVPMIDGRIEAYALDGSTKFGPWLYKSAGRVLTPPVATPRSVSWTTELGHFYVADPAAGGIRYRLETNDAIQARPGYWTPNLYAGSTDGFVYAVEEATGKLIAKSSIGDAIYEPTVAIEDKVFVISEFRGMTCLDSRLSSELWVAPGVTKLLSISPTRVYACDSVNRLVVLDKETGDRLASMPLVDVAVRMNNQYTDRIYLVSATGTVQCLHEVGQKSPVLHMPPPPPPEEKVKLKVRDRDDAPTDEPESPEAPPAAEAKDDAADMPAEFESDDPFAPTP